MLKAFLYLNLSIGKLFQLNPNKDSYINFAAKNENVFAVNNVFIALGQTAIGTKCGSA